MHDAWFFVGVFAFIFLIWIATGGPMHPLAFTGPTLPQPQELGGGTYLSLPRAPFEVGNSYVSLPGSSDGGGSYTYGREESGALPLPTLPGITFGSPSPLRGSIFLHEYVANASSTNAREEYVELSVPQNGSPVNVTGWRFTSEVTGKYAVIPRGTATPTIGIVNHLSDIVLEPGERTYVVTGISPIGVSFRENKCTGYLNPFQRFVPPLSQSCPAPSDEFAEFYGPQYLRDTSCVEYVDSLSTCQAVPFAPRKYQGDLLSDKCKAFVQEQFSYNGCVRTHLNDPDFNGTTWHIYLGQQKYLWRDRYEIVKLLDREFKTIDAFSY